MDEALGAERGCWVGVGGAMGSGTGFQEFGPGWADLGDEVVDQAAIDGFTERSGKGW
jgi:hypothetical protein